jgi:hypothetical protein
MRRAAFFLAGSAVAFLLVPVADGYAWVAATVGALYLLLALGWWLDARSRSSRDPGTTQPP